MSTHQPDWYPDPLGRAARRWFDGVSWTANVVDGEGRQGTDPLPSATPPAAAALTAAGPVPPPPGAAADTWAGPSASHGWDDRRPGLPAVTAPANSWSQPVAPARPVTSSPLRPVALGLIGIAAVAFVLSLFVLDWLSSGPFSASFGDLVGDGTSADGIVDTVTLWHYQWLGYVLVAAGVASALAAVLGALGRARLGHVAAAIVAALGLLVSTLAIVRYFRLPGFDPAFGAWLLPAAFVALLAAVAVSARRTAG